MIGSSGTLSFPSWSYCIFSPAIFYLPLIVSSVGIPACPALGRDRGRQAGSASDVPLLSIRALQKISPKDQACAVAAECEGVGEDNSHLCLTGFPRNIIQITIFIPLLVVEGRRDKLVDDRKN